MRLHFNQSTLFFDNLEMVDTKRVASVLIESGSSKTKLIWFCMNFCGNLLMNTNLITGRYYSR